MNEKKVKVIDKLIFLDIDGVLNNRNPNKSDYITRDKTHHSDGYFKYEMYDSNLQALVKLLKATNATIVLSSAWKNSKESRRIARKYFRKYNIPYYISITPNIGPRLAEILYWLKENTTNIDLLGDFEVKVKNTDANNESNWRLKKRIFVQEWIILDDIHFNNHRNNIDYYYIPGVSGHVVNTDRMYGLTEKEVEFAIQKLNT